MSEEQELVELVFNAIKTPDGTTLVSLSRHDYKTHKDKVSGETYMVDGGLNYTRRSVNVVPYKELSIYSSAPHTDIREVFRWGTRGPKGHQPLQYILLKDLTADHITAIQETQKHISSRVYKLLKNELQYREEISKL